MITLVRYSALSTAIKNTMRFLPLAILLLALISHTSSSQSITKIYDLNEIVRMAQEQSPASRVATNRKENRYWMYRTFKSNYLPQLGLNGTLPSYTRAISPITQPDGSIAFAGTNLANSNIGLSLSQNIGVTGGSVFINSSIQRIDNFLLDSAATSYSASPISIGFQQPLFAFNSLVWDKRIEPLRYEESLKGYVEELEQISLNATSFFFDLLIAQIGLQIAERNVANNDTLYKIATGRYNLGKIAENELLQLELSLMNSRQSLAQAKLDMETSSQRLRAYLGIKDNEPFSLMAPVEIPGFLVNEEIALAEARKNRQRIIGMKREKLEADRDVAQARGDNGLNVNVYAVAGFNQQAIDIPGLYQDPQDQQQIRVGFDIPIVDWGRQKSRIRTAKANQELVYANLEQEQINFDQEVDLQVKRFEMIRSQMEVAKKADEIADKRFEISKNRYQIGKISITDLNIANQEKDQARQAYAQALRNFWIAYYNLRLLTLYDFATNSAIGY